MSEAAAIAWVKAHPMPAAIAAGLSLAAIGAVATRFRKAPAADATASLDNALPRSGLFNFAGYQFPDGDTGYSDPLPGSGATTPANPGTGSTGATPANPGSGGAATTITVTNPIAAPPAATVISGPSIPVVIPSAKTSIPNDIPAAYGSGFINQYEGGGSFAPPPAVGSIEAPSGGVLQWGRWEGNRLVSGTYKVGDSYVSVG